MSDFINRTEIDAVTNTHIVDLRKFSVDTNAISYFNESKVPKILFQTWKSSQFKIEEIKEILKIRESLGKTQFVFHDDDDMFEYMASSWGRHPIHQVFQSLEFGAAKADVWRYCILYEYGGIYLDIDSAFDVSLLDNLDKETDILVSTEDNFVSTDNVHLLETQNWLQQLCPQNQISKRIYLQWLFIAAPKSSALAIAIDLICSRWKQYDGITSPNPLKSIVNFTGPALFTEAIEIASAAGLVIKTLEPDFRGLARFKANAASAAFYLDVENRHYHKAALAKISRKKKALNLGCGNDIRFGFENVDASPLHIDVSPLDIQNAKFERNYYDLIVLRDVLEHLAFPIALQVLRNCLESISPDGKICLQTTSTDSLLNYFRAGRIDITALNYLIFAGVSWRDGRGSWATSDVSEYDWHKSIYSLSLISDFLNTHGFRVIYQRIDGDNINHSSDATLPSSMNMKIWAKRY
jgi:hypothetical protein